jgi:phage/plasmid-like protein (TIGR03299 family)
MKAVQYNLNGVKTAVEALEESHLNWEAMPINMITENGISVPKNKAIVRSDNNSVIGVVGNKYVPIQNSFAFSFFDIVCEQHNAKYDKAYVIDEGRKVILEAIVDGPVEIRKGDEVLRKIRLINTFDGSFPLMAQFVVWRQVCKNGLMGWANESKCKIHHTKKGEDKTKEALRVLSTSISFFEKFELKCKELANKVIDRKCVNSFLDQCFKNEGGTRQKNLRDKIIECYEADKGTGQGTAWDLYNGYVEWIDHYRSADYETRLANSVLGSSSMKEEAFVMIERLVNE